MSPRRSPAAGRLQFTAANSGGAETDYNHPVKKSPIELQNCHLDPKNRHRPVLEFPELSIQLIDSLLCESSSTRELEEGSKKTEEGSKKTEEGSKKTEEGAKKTEEGSKKTEEGSKKTEEGSKKTDGTHMMVGAEDSRKISGLAENQRAGKEGKEVRDGDW